jgi:hypothetical protein
VEGWPLPAAAVQGIVFEHRNLILRHLSALRLQIETKRAARIE